MQPIKFRFWNKEHKVYEFRYLINNEGMIIDPMESNYPLNNQDNIIIEQFTSLYDRKGKEIYEGDIFKRPYSYKELYIVDDIMNLGFYIYEMGWESNDIEVIGNIHETPKLLETK